VSAAPLIMPAGLQLQEQKKINLNQGRLASIITCIFFKT